MTAPSWRMSWMRLQNQLMERRKAVGLTQDEAARKLTVSRSTFQRWERGDAVPGGYELFRWANLLGIEITSSVTAESVNSDALEAA